jgi:hypothetical protein
MEWFKELLYMPDGRTLVLDADDAEQLADRADRAEANAAFWQSRYSEEAIARREAEAERDALLLEIGAWRCTVEAREADVKTLREALELIQANMQRIDAIPWGNDGDGGASDLAEDSHAIARAALNQTTNTNDQ